MFLWRKRLPPDCIIFGLGNPGPMYASTRHNLGFMAVDSLCEMFPGANRYHRWRSEVVELSLDVDKLVAALRTGAREEAAVAVDALRRALEQRELKSHRLLAVKPLTFMNLSGRAVAQVINANRGVPFLVISDDVNLPWGELRLRERGGAGGHKGLASIIDELGGYRDFLRVRIGVGGGELAEVSDYVLTPLDEGECVQAKVLARAAAAKALEVACVGYEFAASSGFLNQQED